VQQELGGGMAERRYKDYNGRSVYRVGTQPLNLHTATEWNAYGYKPIDVDDFDCYGIGGDHRNYYKLYNEDQAMEINSKDAERRRELYHALYDNNVALRKHLYENLMETIHATYLERMNINIATAFTGESRDWSRMQFNDRSFVVQRIIHESVSYAEPLYKLYRGTFNFDGLIIDAMHDWARGMNIDIDQNLGRRYKRGK
jgi:hypothetical protein